MWMKFVGEFLAIIAVIIGFCLKTEAEGGDGVAKKERAITEIMQHLRSPEGFYIPWVPVQTAVEGMLRLFLLDLIVKALQGTVFFGSFEKPNLVNALLKKG